MYSNKEQIIYDAKNGNKSALIELIRLEQKYIYKFIYYLKKNDDEINDIIQDVLIKMMSKIHQLKDIKSYKSWLNKIILNTYYDYFRKSKKLSKISLTGDDKILGKAKYEPNPQEHILDIELNKIIAKGIKKMPIHYKIPLTLREIKGLSYSDISNITKATIGTVKSRIARARNILQKKIDKYTKE